MKFRVMENTYKTYGTAKAFAVSDQYNRYYYIPRSQVKVIEVIEPQSKFDMTQLIIEVPDWIIRKNGIPVFTLTEMDLER